MAAQPSGSMIPGVPSGSSGIIPWVTGTAPSSTPSQPDYQGYNSAPPPPQNTAATPLSSNPGLNNINTNQGAPMQTVTGPAYAPSFAPVAPPPPPVAPQQLQAGQGSPGDVGFNGNVPGVGENVAGSYLDYYGNNGTPTTSQDTGQAYQDFLTSTPANMDPYYNNAQRLSDNAINTQMAARGSYGSSNAVGVLSNADTNLRTQQAKDEAQYGLSRAGLEGTLASGADQSSQAASQNEENWMKGLTDLGFNAQKEGTARYELGNQDALTAANTASGIQGQVGSQDIAAQQQLLIQQLTAQGMSASDAATAAHNAVSADNAQNAAAVNTAASALSYFV